MFRVYTSIRLLNIEVDELPAEFEAKANKDWIYCVFEGKKLYKVYHAKIDAEQKVNNMRHEVEVKKLQYKHGFGDEEPQISSDDIGFFPIHPGTAHNLCVETPSEDREKGRYITTIRHEDIFLQHKYLTDVKVIVCP